VRKVCIACDHEVANNAPAYLIPGCVNLVICRVCATASYNDIYGRISRVGLTKRQQELLSFIRSYNEKYGIIPSYDEMKDGINLKSKSGIHRMIVALAERGHIKRRSGRARAISLVELV